MKTVTEVLKMLPEAAKYLLNATSIYILSSCYCRIPRFSGMPWRTFCLRILTEFLKMFNDKESHII